MFNRQVIEKQKLERILKDIMTLEAERKQEVQSFQYGECVQIEVGVLHCPCKIRMDYLVNRYTEELTTAQKYVPQLSL